MTKILYITSRADFGGGPEHLFQLIKGLHYKFEVFVACPNDYPYYQRYSKIIGHERITIIPHRKFSLKSVNELRRLIHKEDIRIVHSHGKGAGIYSRILKMFNAIKSVHTFHGLHVAENNSVREFIYLALERILASITDSFIAVSESELKKIQRNLALPGDKLHLIPNGVDVPQSVEQKNRTPGKFNILQITRFDDAKNPMLIAEIAAELKRINQFEIFKFILIGDGDGRPALEKAVQRNKLSEQFEFRGFVDDVSSELKSADVYLSTSKMEGLPLSMLTAMGNGIPCVATKVTGNVDIVEHNKNGILYNLEDSSGAAEALNLLYSNEDLYNTLSVHAQNTVRNKFSLDAMIKSTIKLYNSLCGVN